MTTLTPHSIDVEYQDVFMSPVLYRPTFAGVNKHDVDTFLDRVRALGADIASYLNTQGIKVVDSEVEVTLDYKLLNNSVALLLHVPLQGGLQIVPVQTLSNRNTRLMGRYKVHPYTMSLLWNVYSIDKLVAAIKEALPYYECSMCHYSNEGGEYCGRGLELATAAGCTSFKVSHPVITRQS
ncbi:hypothetical protein [Microcoleus phage My-WqHQDG]|nr:hypothetical protein [Microcoleus phage My-WqHQDG]